MNHVQLKTQQKKKKGSTATIPIIIPTKLAHHIPERKDGAEDQFGVVVVALAWLRGADTSHVESRSWRVRGGAWASHFGAGDERFWRPSAFIDAFS